MIYYYRIVTNKPPSPPMQASDVEDIIARSTRMFLDRERISTAEQKKRLNDEVVKAAEEVKAEKEKEQSATNKQQSKDDANVMEKVSSQNPNENGKDKPSPSKSGGASTGGGGDGAPMGEPMNERIRYETLRLLHG